MSYSFEAEQREQGRVRLGKDGGESLIGKRFGSRRHRQFSLTDLPQLSSRYTCGMNSCQNALFKEKGLLCLLHRHLCPSTVG